MHSTWIFCCDFRCAHINLCPYTLPFLLQFFCCCFWTHTQQWEITGIIETALQHTISLWSLYIAIFANASTKTFSQQQIGCHVASTLRCTGHTIHNVSLSLSQYPHKYTTENAYAYAIIWFLFIDNCSAWPHILLNDTMQICFVVYSGII